MKKLISIIIVMFASLFVTASFAQSKLENTSVGAVHCAVKTAGTCGFITNQMITGCQQKEGQKCYMCNQNPLGIANTIYEYANGNLSAGIEHYCQGSGNSLCKPTLDEYFLSLKCVKFS